MSVPVVPLEDLPRCGAAPSEQMGRVRAGHRVGGCAREIGHYGPHHYPLVPPVSVYCPTDRACDHAGVDIYTVDP